jgi:predicted metal-binding membrane protein
MEAPALQGLGPGRGRVSVPLALAAVVVAGWAGTLGMGAAMKGHAAHHAGLAALFAMWAAMAVAMMVPVEAPSLLRVARGLRETGAFLAGYLLPWLAFSIGAAGLQQSLHAAGWMDAGMATSSRGLAAALLVAAGLVQLSPAREACLARCRAAALTSAGTGGLAGGLRASVSSVACCGLLMLVPLATGMMSIAWMVALTLLLVVERELPRASRIGALAGVLLLVFGAWKFAT